MDKKEMRKNILGIRNNCTKEYLIKASKAICDKIVKLKEYSECSNICIYMPIKNEVDLTGIIDYSVGLHKKVYLPKISENEMHFYLYNKGDVLEIGKYNILEPKSTIRLCPTNDTLVIMPGAVFSYNNDRIGYGGGYYDNYLSKNSMCQKIAVCYKFQILAEIPIEVHDIKPDKIIHD